jgi:hypothetical protein
MQIKLVGTGTRNGLVFGRQIRLFPGSRQQKLSMILLKTLLRAKHIFYRAINYYRLTNQFGDVPCPLKELTGVKTNYATVKEK